MKHQPIPNRHSLRSRNILWLLLITFCMTLTACFETEVLARGTVRDSVTGLPIDSVHVVQFWIEKKDKRILNESYTDSLGRFVNYDFVGCGTRRCRFMVVFERDGYWPQTFNNQDDAFDIRLVAQ